ncbi:transporter substrate-binding domain-containing protein [Vagococcus acidifermentans]|uniref:ABC transporter substrate-binding protein n=1 Tax=Vagococcus acidifermentans TaxID=564710 RepID=A0A430B0U3_9ENTE|nr:transporter substrate-binding domain-containing protein [Vagococcus acidifermentans]RSU13963.1 ABC transporter substrate-binding protein [Vagococcus acidifermentans]
MKKVLFGFAAAVIGLTLTACGSSQSSGDDSLTKVEKKKAVTVATSGTLFPSSYYNDDTQLTGYDVEVSREIAKRLNWDITFKEYNVDGQLESLNNGTADFAANDFGLSKEREKRFSLSTPIKYSFDSMIVRKSDNSGISKLEDLKGKRAAGEASTGYMKLAESYGAELVVYDNATNDQYLTDVANGRTDVILNDYYLQKMSVGALPDIPVKILEDVYFNPSSSGLLFKKDHQALRKKIDATLKDMQDDGTLSKLAQQFFGDDVSQELTGEFQEITPLQESK